MAHRVAAEDALEDRRVNNGRGHAMEREPESRRFSPGLISMIRVRCLPADRGMAPAGLGQASVPA
jgi:hypothetical protein